MWMIEYRKSSWWYWLASACLLTAGVNGWRAGFPLAIGLTVLQCVHFAIRERGIAAFPVQVRLGYLLLLVVALPEPLRFLYWVPAVGTWAQVLFGYCALARMLSLLPWNRSETMTAALLRRTFLSAPVRGNILQGLPPA